MSEKVREFDFINCWEPFDLHTFAWDFPVFTHMGLVYSAKRNELAKRTGRTNWRNELAKRNGETHNMYNCKYEPVHVG